MIRPDSATKWDGGVKEDYFLNMLDKWVQWTQENQLYCIINIKGHSVPNPEKYGSYGMPYWIYDEYGEIPRTLSDQAKIVHDFWDIEIESMDDEREIYIDLWKYIANRYKEYDHVMYAPVNEPIHHTYQYTTKERIERIGQSYSIIMTELVNAIRSTGSDQIVFVDRPYVLKEDTDDWLAYIHPVNGTNVVWESHVYVSKWHSLNEWLNRIDEFIDKFKDEYNAPLYIGEWGFDPMGLRFELEDWKNVTLEQVEYLNERDISWTFHSWGRLFGQENWVNIGTDNYLEKDEIEYIMNTLFG